MHKLQAKFQIKDLGPVKDLLHMEISYVPGQFMWMSQSGYLDKVLTRFGIEECRPVSTTQALVNLPAPVEDNHPDMNNPKLPYQELVGSIQYLVQGTRPDLANAVRTLGKSMSKYTKEHFVMVKRAMCYLQGTREYGLLWKKPVCPT